MSKKYFDIDFQKLAVLLLPTMLRQSRMMTFLQAMITPFVAIYNLFVANRDNNNYWLNITPQVCYLEKALNDRFDIQQRRIYIADGVRIDAMYIYTQAEGFDIHLSALGEAVSQWLYTPKEVGAESADFIVHVPGDLQFDIAEMQALVDTYKLATKTYIISKF